MWIRYIYDWEYGQREMRILGADITLWVIKLVKMYRRIWYRETETVIIFCHLETLYDIQFSLVAQSCLALCDPMNHGMPGLPVHHQLPEFTQTHVHWVGDSSQPSHPLPSPSPPAPNPSQHQGLFQWVNSSHQVAKVLEFQLQQQSFNEHPGLISFRMD